MKTTIVIIASCLFLGSAFARIGETPAECQARYGTPLKFDKEANKIIFQKGQLLFIVSFYEGKCDRIVFRKAEQDILGNPKELTDNEIELLRNANGKGLKWKEMPIMALLKLWETEDGSIRAQYETMDRVLSIYTMEALARQMADKKEQEQKQLDGF